MENNRIFSHKDLIVWQKAMKLVVLIYNLTNAFPASELYGLTAQMRSAAVSIPSNIAEGKRRGLKKSFVSFLRIAFASSAELETQLEIATSLRFLKEEEVKPALGLIQEIQKMLTALQKKLHPHFLQANS